MSSFGLEWIRLDWLTLVAGRAREIQAQEGRSPNIWGPPTSGNSTPLRENIPESPTQDGFPDLKPPADSSNSLNSPARRVRAGTVPSRFSPVGTINGVNVQQALLTKSSRPTPSTSPFKPTVQATDQAVKSSAPPSSNSALLSRLRAGSMPHRTNIPPSANPFSSSLLTSGWNGSRERTSTLASIRSLDDPSSPAQSSFSKEGLTDNDVKTLDYLGLVETPQQPRASLAMPTSDSILQQQQQQQMAGLPQLLAELNSMNNNPNRFRSYSVNAKERYAEDDDDAYNGPYSGMNSGTLTPSAATLQAQIHQHNLAVQAFANHASASRPRARTAGVLDAAPQRSALRSYLGAQSRFDNGINAAGIPLDGTGDLEGLSEAVQLLQLNGMGSRLGQENTEDGNIDGPTRALWIGSIPVSTTVSSLDAIFNRYGTIESTRVLTHKNCGFVNFERVESAMQAKSLLNGKEIFPGAGAVRIGYAKVPASSASGTPSHNGLQPSPTPDPTVNKTPVSTTVGTSGSPGNINKSADATAAAMHVPELPDLRSEMLQIVSQFGANDTDIQNIENAIDSAITYQIYESEIPPIADPSPTRMYDAPRLRDIRKRIDNGTCSVQEIEETANGMLPEIAELSSDYLGNTVVQKLFEFCSEDTKGQMLNQIAPHLAEVGIHKNGTWAAQKIIDVTSSPEQISSIVNSIRPYTVPLFLDQYGNYVLQCCLKFGAPFHGFIFETMLSRMWEIAQGRFGARAMRACLESHCATKDQQRMLAAAIAQHSVQLASNTNGALLLTWFLDTCTFPHRRTVLAPRLIPHLVHLCTHKVAYLTVLKVINQRNEPEARDSVLQALFFSPGDAVLEQILSDSVSGATFIFKVLTTPFFDENMRAEVVNNVSKVLAKIKPGPNQGYKRLMDEVGLSSRGGSAHHQHSHPHSQGDRSRPMSSNNNSNFMSPSGMTERQFGNQMLPNLQMPPFDNPSAPVRSSSADSSTFSTYGLNGVGAQGGQYNQSHVQQMTPQQIPYQSYLNGPQRTMSGSSGSNFVGGVQTTGYGGYATPPSSVDSFRNMSNHSSSPILPQGQMTANPLLGPGIGGYGGQAFSPIAANGANVFGYPQQGFFTQQHMQSVQQSGARRGRVSATTGYQDMYSS